MDWDRFYAEDLLEVLQSSATLTGIMEPAAGIYIWKLRLRPSCHPNDVDSLMKHIDRVSSLPQGRIRDVSLSRSMLLEGLRMGGSGLPEGKMDSLRQLAQSKKGATYLFRYLESLEARTPGLYCGEAGNIPARLAQHLSGKTDFSEAVHADPELSWGDLLVEILVTGQAQDEGVETNQRTSRRRAMEYLTTLMTSSMFTQRAG